MNRKDVCPGEIDFYVLRSLRNDALKGRGEIIKDVKREILSAEVDMIVSRYTAVADPLLNELVPFKAVTDAIKKNCG